MSCSFYSPEQISSPISARNPPPSKRIFSRYFTCFWIRNIRGGLTSKLEEITQILLVGLNNVDVAVLVETSLHGGIPDDLIRIPGYFAFRKDRDNSRVGGGILVYVRNGLPFHAQPKLDKVDLEVLWLLYRRPLMPREVSHILVGAVYHPPSAQNGRMLKGKGA